MDASNVTEPDVASQAAAMGLPLKPEDVAPLTTGIRRNLEMAAACRELVTDGMAPVLFPQPVRRRAKGI
jgi:hypothetical protein